MSGTTLSKEKPGNKWAPWGGGKWVPWGGNWNSNSGEKNNKNKKKTRVTADDDDDDDKEEEEEEDISEIVETGASAAVATALASASASANGVDWSIDAGNAELSDTRGGGVEGAVGQNKAGEEEGGSRTLKEGRWLPTEMARFVEHLDTSLHRDGKTERKRRRRPRQEGGVAAASCVVSCFGFARGERERGRRGEGIVMFCTRLSLDH